MSYILDALKKSDQQRQRGATPTLPTAQSTVTVPKQSFPVYYGVLAGVLLCAGIAIGWLHPWQAEQPMHAAAPFAARPVPPTPNQVSPPLRPDQPGMANKPEQTLPVPDMAPPPASPAVAVQDQKAVALSELPPAIRQEIPAMTIQLHSYSNKPINSIVSINSRMMKEGESLAPGLKLEQITPDGVIFSYKGYRFQHGIW
jgi:general secretion pathway protein B